MLFLELNSKYSLIFTLKIPCPSDAHPFLEDNSNSYHLLGLADYVTSTSRVLVHVYLF